MTDTNPEGWDILERGWAEGTDEEAMSQGHHYDYGRQTWVEGHDHGHIPVTYQTTDPMMFCFADLATCQGGTR